MFDTMPPVGLVHRDASCHALVAMSDTWYCTSCGRNAPHGKQPESMLSLLHCHCPTRTAPHLGSQQGPGVSTAHLNFVLCGLSATCQTSGLRMNARPFGTNGWSIVAPGLFCAFVFCTASAATHGISLCPGTVVHMYSVHPNAQQNAWLPCLRIDGVGDCLQADARVTKYCKP